MTDATAPIQADLKLPLQTEHYYRHFKLLVQKAMAVAVAREPVAIVPHDQQISFDKTPTHPPPIESVKFARMLLSTSLPMARFSTRLCTAPTQRALPTHRARVIRALPATPTTTTVSQTAELIHELEQLMLTRAEDQPGKRRVLLDTVSLSLVLHTNT